MEKGDIMKSIKKYILIITMALLTITLSACSKVTPEQALNKVAEASKNIKNTEFSVIVSTESTSGDKTRKIEAKITGAVINEPLAIHANTEIKSTRTTSLDMYIKDNVLYAKNDGSCLLYTSSPILLILSHVSLLAYTGILYLRARTPIPLI